MKIIYIILLAFPLQCLAQSNSFCALKFYKGMESADSLINAEINHEAWDNWNILETGIQDIRYYRCEIDNYYSYNPHLYQEYARLLIQDSIFLFPYYNFFEGECFIKGAKSITDSILRLKGFDEQYFYEKKNIAKLKVDEHKNEIFRLTDDGNECKGGKICEEYSGSIEKVIVESYLKNHDSELPPFYFTPYMNTSSTVSFRIKVNKRGVIKELTFGSFGEFSMRQNETPTQIRLLKQIIIQSLLNKKVYSPYFYNGKRKTFEEEITVSISWR